MRYGFQVVGLDRIVSATVPANAASRRVMETCGPTFQGELFARGATLVWYAVDRAEWEATAGKRPTP